ncbi:unnamed protein product [Chrysoparadoxa australica]
MKRARAEPSTTSKAHAMFVYGHEKAGMDQSKRDHVNEVIMKTTEGSKYHSRMKEQDERVEEEAKELRLKLQRARPEQLQRCGKDMDKLVAEMESARDLSKACCVVDMDMFFAAVELRDRPELRGKPIAVGGMSMISTTNYEARKFGVRSAMPGFVGVQLCPELVFVPHSFEKYQQVSEQVKQVFQRYDPSCTMMSLDEAYLDLTAVAVARVNAEGGDKDDPKQVLKQAEILTRKMRAEVQAATQLTCSAGLGANFMLAKICSDKNKPDGQFAVEPTREAILEFCQDLPTRSVPGIGRVTEKKLEAVLGVATCGELLQKGAEVMHVFSEHSAKSLLRAALGISRNQIVMEERKSYGKERTFRDTRDEQELLKRCREMCHDVVAEAAERNKVGKLAVLKLKAHDFKTETHNCPSVQWISRGDQMYALMSCALSKELKQRPTLKLRLMGVRLEKLKSCKDAPDAGQRLLEDMWGEVLEDEVEEVEAQGCPVCGAKLVGGNSTSNVAHIDHCLGMSTSSSTSNGAARAGSGKKKRVGKAACGTLDKYFK